MANKNNENKRVPYYSVDRKLYPMTQTRYVKKGKNWVPVSSKTETISYNQTKNVLSKQGMPFERSHKLEKRDRYLHSHDYDTFSTISPDGNEKVTYYVDFPAGEKERSRLSKKSYADKERYRAKKNSKR